MEQPKRLSKELSALVGAMRLESDRGAMVLAASYVDELLRRLLLQKMVASDVSRKLLDPESGQLKGLVLRGRVACSLGLIEAPDLDLIEKLAKCRDVLAHCTVDLLESNRWFKNQIGQHSEDAKLFGEDDRSFGSAQLIGELKLTGIVLVHKLSCALFDEKET